jgi:hypothetical protein
MQSTVPSTIQVFTPFGGGFMHEEAADATHSNLVMFDHKTLMSSLTASMLAEIMASLRSALLLR